MAIATDRATSPKVAAALRLDGHALDYQVKYTPAEAAELVAHLGDYNNATHRVLAGLLNAIDNLIPPMDFGDCNGSPNPNNGRAHHKYRIGREGSRVVYVDIYGAYIRPYGWAADEWAHLAAELLKLGRWAEADESNVKIHGDITNSGHLECRYWWD